MRVHLDDERTTPEGRVRVYRPQEAIALPGTGRVATPGLGHDRGRRPAGSRHDLVRRIEEAVALRGLWPPGMSVHSADSSARRKLEPGLRSIEAPARARVLGRP